MYLLKQIKHEIASPLTIVINKYISEGCFPFQLKVAKVVPVYKTLGRHNCCQCC